MAWYQRLERNSVILYILSTQLIQRLISINRKPMRPWTADLSENTKCQIRVKKSGRRRIQNTVCRFNEPFGKALWPSRSFDLNHIQTNYHFPDSPRFHMIFGFNYIYIYIFQLYSVIVGIWVTLTKGQRMILTSSTQKSWGTHLPKLICHLVLKYML